MHTYPLSARLRSHENHLVQRQRSARLHACHGRGASEQRHLRSSMWVQTDTFAHMSRAVDETGKFVNYNDKEGRIKVQI